MPKQKKQPSELEESFAQLWRRFGNGMEPVREYKFIEGRKFKADFAWPHKNLVVEIDGGQWSKGSHNTGLGKRRDAERDRLAVLAGWRIMRFVNNDLEQRPIQCCEEVTRALAQ